jgi:autotransporter translocation and assembly factor TamB
VIHDGEQTELVVRSGNTRVEVDLRARPEPEPGVDEEPDQTPDDDGGAIDDPVRMYLREIGKVRLLRGKEEVELAMAMKAGDHEVDRAQGSLACGIKLRRLTGDEVRDATRAAHAWAPMLGLDDDVLEAAVRTLATELRNQSEDARAACAGLDGLIRLSEHGADHACSDALRLLRQDDEGIVP